MEELKYKSKRRNLTTENTLEVINSLKDGIKSKDVAKKHNICYSTVRRIANNRMKQPNIDDFEGKTLLEVVSKYASALEDYIKFLKNQ